MRHIPKKVLLRCTNNKPKGDRDDELGAWAEDEVDSYDEPEAPSCGYQESEGTGCPHNRAEIIVDGHLTLPIAKPDMDEILRCLAKPTLSHWDLIDSDGHVKAIISGTVAIRTEYVAASAEHSVHVATFKIPFHTMLTSCHRIKRVTVKPLYRYNEIIDPRSLSFVVVLAVSAT